MYNGILNIYKEKGYTSHDVVAKLRGILKQKKIGHTGTLDPDATGVLPICLGGATKLCDMLTDKEKAYRTTFVLGKETDTQDISGTVINELDIAKKRDILTDEKLVETILSFVGEYDQIPPMYSAIKVNGKKLYELARAGIEIERKSRRVNILAIKDIQIDYPKISMEVHCSKGTYIRTLCHDIGNALSVYGCMTELERVKSGAFEKEGAITLKEVEELTSEGKIEEVITPVDNMFKDYKRVDVTENLSKPLMNGNPLNISSLKKDGISIVKEETVRIYSHEGSFIGIYKEKNGMLRPEKLFFC